MEFTGVSDMWLQAYVDEYMNNYKADVLSAKINNKPVLKKIKEFLRSEKPSPYLIDKIVRFGDITLVKTFEKYLTKDILNNAIFLSLSWIYQDPVWLYNLLLQRGADAALYISVTNRGHETKTKLFRSLEVNETNAQNVAEVYNKKTYIVRYEAIPFFLSYPEYFDLDVFASNLHHYINDDKVLEFAVTIDGIFSKEIEYNIYVLLVEIILKTPVHEEILSVISDRLLRDLPKFDILADQVYYLLAEIEYRTTYDLPVYFALLMKARNYEDAPRLRKRIFQEKFLGGDFGEEIENKLDDSFDSLIYLLDFILTKKNC